MVSIVGFVMPLGKEKKKTTGNSTGKCLITHYFRIFTPFKIYFRYFSVKYLDPP